MLSISKQWYVVLMLVLALVSGCDSGGGGSQTVIPTVPATDITDDDAEEEPTTTDVGGSGVKGPLTGAEVNLYAVDLSQTSLQGELLGSGTTGPDAGIQDLSIPDTTTGLVLLEFLVVEDTLDLTTGAAPIFDALYTVIDVSRVLDGDDIYASPLTTMAVNLAVRNADDGSPYSGDSDGTITETEFLAALDVAQNRVKSTLGFGMSNDIDIFTTPPLVNNSTDDATSQANVAAYRQAIEALGAVAASISNDGGGDNPQAAFDALTEDLSDGVIDGNSDTGPVAAFSTVTATLAASVTQDVTNLVIPGTNVTIGEIEQVLASEASTTGTTSSVADLAGGQISINPSPASVSSDIDGDGIPDSEDTSPTVADTGTTEVAAVWDEFNWDEANWQD